MGVYNSPFLSLLDDKLILRFIPSSSLLGREKLRQYKEAEGHFRVPCNSKRGTKRRRESGDLEEDPSDGKEGNQPVEGAGIDKDTLKLGNWIKRQRRMHINNELPERRVQALLSIGYSFGPMMPPTKKERLDIQLGLLDELRKSRDLDEAQVQDLNILYSQWERRGKQGLKGKSKRARGSAAGTELTNKHDARWMQNLELLKQYQVSQPTRLPSLTLPFSKYCMPLLIVAY